MPAQKPTSKPTTRDRDASKETILIAATEEFAEKGLRGARVDQIAERAGVNKRMLYYYFGQKDDLFLVVLERTYEKIRDEERKLNLTEVEPVEAIRRLISFTWNYYLQNPEFIPLLNSENLHKAVHLKQSKKIQSLHSPFVFMLEEVLARGRQEGVFRSGADPVQLYITIASLAYFYLSNKHTLSTIFNRDLLSQRARAERLSHMTDVVLGYLIQA
ncbi:MAG: AcrR family transcriptional regulator [bacterium]